MSDGVQRIDRGRGGKSCRRLSRRQRCRGDLCIQRSGGGPALPGTLIDIGSGGARVALDRPLADGEMVRIVFPRKPGEAVSSGRTMIGSVVHTSDESGRHVVGIAFGWDAGVRGKSVRIDRRPSSSWLGSLLGRVRGRRSSPARP